MSILNELSNKLLPNSIQNKLLDEEITSIELINKNLIKLIEFEDAIIDSKLLGATIRAINTHISLHYKLPIDMKSKIANTLTSIYQLNQMSFGDKTKILTLLTNILKKKEETLDYIFNYKIFWNEVLDRLLRENKYGSCASEEIIAGYVYKLVDFIHIARRYVSLSDTSIGEIITSANNKLSINRSTNCIEGLLLLVNCLPTYLPETFNYDKLLPTWLDIWKSIQLNATWDVAWLTIFSRARKYCKSFDWNSIYGMLLLKAKEFLQIGKADGDHNNQHRVASYYSALLNTQEDIQKIGLKKIVKLIYFIIVRKQDGSYILGDPITVTPVNLIEEIDISIPGYNFTVLVKSEAVELSIFLQSIRLYFYPSNNGNWTNYLTYFVQILIEEISKHIGYSISKKNIKLLDNQSNRSNHSIDLYYQPLHLPTVHYLIGSTISLILEGLYGKSTASIYACALSIKNIISIDSSYSYVFLPILMQAFDKDNVTQSHLIPSVLHAFIVCIQQLVNPNPIILNHLPSLLQLSIPGLDPSDQMKTFLTLELYSVIFSNITIQSQYDTTNDKNNKSYIHYANISTDHVLTNQLIDFESTYETLSSIWSEWIPQFIDKVFILCDQMPPKNKEKKQNNLVSLLVNCVNNFLLAVKSREYNAIYESKLQSYFLSTSIYTSDKVISKLLSIYVEIEPDYIQKVFKLLLNDNLLDCKFSNEKIAFRLRLISTCFLSVNSKNLIKYKDQINLLLNNNNFINSNEKSIRKFYIKLCKNLLKGLTSTYIVSNNISNEPIIISKNYIKWHEIDESSLLYAIDVLKLTINQSISNITNILTTNQSSNGVDLSIKKTEENIIFNLKLINKCLIGSADILGDDIDNEVISTGRDALLDKLTNESDRTYLKRLRYDVLTFLDNLYIVLNSTTNNNERNNNIDSLSNSVDIYKNWLKVLKTLVITRISTNKDFNSYKKSLDSTVQIKTSSITKAVQKYIIRNQLVTSDANNDDKSLTINNVNYWIVNDLTYAFVSFKAFLTYQKRCYELSKQSIKVSNNSIQGAILLKCLYNVIDLTTHTYDKIRPLGIKLFDTIINKFSSNINPIINYLVSNINTITQSVEKVVESNEPYSKLAGYFSILKLKYVLKHVTYNIELLDKYLSLYINLPTICNTIADNEKRNRFEIIMIESFNRYLTVWNHLPVNQTNTKYVYNIISQIVAYLNHKNDQLTSSNSLRYDSIVGFIVLHFIGHPDISIDLSVYEWAISSISTEHEHPIQQIAFAALLRLLYKDYITKSFDNNISLLLNNLLSSQSNVSWFNFIYGISLCHPKDGTNSKSQWSLGIDNILHTSHYLSLILSRRIFFDIAEDSRKSSTKFQLRISQLFVCIFDVLINSTSSLTIDQLNGILDTTSRLANDNIHDENNKINNCIKAEVLSGLVTSYNQHFYSRIDSKSSDSYENNVNQVLINFYNSAISSISKDYNSDWIDCVYASYLQNNNRNITAFSSNILSSFKSIFTSISDGVSSKEDRFLYKSKILSLLRTIVTAEMITLTEKSIDLTSSPIVNEVVSILNNIAISDYVSTYEYIRYEMSMLLGTLSCHAPTDFSVQIDQLIKLKNTYSSDDESNNNGSESSNYVKYIVYVCNFWLKYIVTYAVIYSTKFNQLNGITTINTYISYIPSLLSVMIEGTGHADLEFSKDCHEEFVFAVKCIIIYLPNENDNLTDRIIDLLISYSKHESWHIRETVSVSIRLFLDSHWFILTNDQKKLIKDAIVELFYDNKLEIQQSAYIAMILYLSYKTSSEMSTIASAYTKNCESIAVRENKKRKQKNESNSINSIASLIKSDRTYWNTICMSCCIIKCYPYDLPAYIPALLSALIKHISNPILQNLITKTIQDFKRSHQDKWNQFSLMFTREQLDDLQGTGSAHYFA